MKIMRHIYTNRQAEQVRKDFLPYREKYAVAIKNGIRLASGDEKRLLDLSHKLTDYYVHRKLWDNYDDFSEAMHEADPFGMFNHRMSVAIRIVKIKDQKKDSTSRLHLSESSETSAKLVA
jgi:hypothetical protein